MSLYKHRLINHWLYNFHFATETHNRLLHLLKAPGCFSQLLWCLLKTVVTSFGLFDKCSSFCFVPRLPSLVLVTWSFTNFKHHFPAALHLKPFVNHFLDSWLSPCHQLRAKSI